MPAPLSGDLTARIQRIEDRTAIVETIVKYATSIDSADWTGFSSIFTDPVHVDFSEAGLPAADFARDQFVGFAKTGLEAWDARQHLSPNHIVTFDETNLDSALCTSYMYAQHFKRGTTTDEAYLMRGSYENHMVRTPDGWKITRLTQRIFWLEGNPDAAHEVA